LVSDSVMDRKQDVSFWPFNLPGARIVVSDESLEPKYQFRRGAIRETNELCGGDASGSPWPRSQAIPQNLSPMTKRRMNETTLAIVLTREAKGSSPK
jgi:hypothetical protein